MFSKTKEQPASFADIGSDTVAVVFTSLPFTALVVARTSDDKVGFPQALEQGLLPAIVVGLTLGVTRVVIKLIRDWPDRS